MKVIEFIGLFFILFSCRKDIAVVTLYGIDDITGNSATCNGKILHKDISTIKMAGFCWNARGKPSIRDNYISVESGSGNFSGRLSNLSPDKQYYVRAFVTNCSRTAYSNELKFTTLVSDIDGNLYHSVRIGSQIWMIENLNVSHYQNGEPILSNGSGETAFYRYYNNDSALSAKYGKLYTWFAVKDKRKLPPDGWHIPDETEWERLIRYLGGEKTAGGKLKESGKGHWQNPNTGASNISGFTALPGGWYSGWGIDQPFEHFGYKGYWWSSTGKYSAELNTWEAVIYSLSSDSHNIGRDTIQLNEPVLFSVRCIKDRNKILRFGLPY